MWDQIEKIVNVFCFGYHMKCFDYTILKIKTKQNLRNLYLVYKWSNRQQDLTRHWFLYSQDPIYIAMRKSNIIYTIQCPTSMHAVQWGIPAGLLWYHPSFHTIYSQVFEDFRLGPYHEDFNAWSRFNPERARDAKALLYWRWIKKFKQ